MQADNKIFFLLYILQTLPMLNYLKTHHVSGGVDVVKKTHSVQQTWNLFEFGKSSGGIMRHNNQNWLKGTFGQITVSTSWY